MKIFMDFAILRREGLTRKSLLAARAEIRECERALKEFDCHIDAALQHPNLSAASKRFIKQQWYGDARGGALSLGNRSVHRAAMISSITVLLLHAQNEPSARQGRLRFRMLTTTPDLGITDFDTPEINFAAVCRQFDVTARRAGVDALAFMDLAIIDERLTLEPMRIAIHMHAAVRAMDTSFRTKTAQRVASSARRPLNRLGLKVVKISAKKRDWGQALRRMHVAKLGYYVRKISCGLKVPYFDQFGIRRTRTTLHGWKLEHALRQLECYTHFDAWETTRGVGQGGVLRAHWKSLVLGLLRCDDTARGLKIDHDRLEREWTRIWTELGTGAMRAVHVVG